MSPIASAPPMVSSRNPGPDRSTRMTAPSTARLPQEMLTPSKAGPAAVEVVRIRWLSVSMISPLVPRSTARVGRVAVPGKSKWARQARASEPTKPPISGGRLIRALAEEGTPIQSMFGR